MKKLAWCVLATAVSLMNSVARVEKPGPTMEKLRLGNETVTIFRDAYGVPRSCSQRQPVIAARGGFRYGTPHS